MQFVQTLWTGTSEENPVGIKAGWRSAEYHWISWALSCLQAKSVFGEVNLVTDKKGKEVLIDQLQLPYASVSIDLEQKLDHYPQSLFALAKIFTYSIQTEPFLHLDGDVFIWHKPDDNFLNAPLMAQNIDKNLGLYLETLNEINKHFTYIPSVLLKETYAGKDIYASNAGLLGGSDLSFIKEYCRQAFEFINKNKNDLSKLNTNSLNFIIEQYLFYQLADKANIPINHLNGVVDVPIFKDYIKFDDFPHVQMAHPVGGFKKYRHVCDHVAKKLRKDYPDYYYRIINWVRNSDVNMHSSIYYSAQFGLDLLSPPPVEKAITIAESKISFDRTNAAVDYLNKKNSVAEEIDLNTDITQTDFADRLIAKLPDGPDKDRLLEIFRLESERNLLIKALYANRANVSQLYEEDLKAYELIQKTFSLPEVDWIEVEVIATEKYGLVELEWDWRCDFKEDIKAIIERNFNEERSSYTVLLLPDVLEGDIVEYHVDELDAIIFDTMKDKSTIKEVFLQMKQYFSPEEIEEDYLSFKLLIISIIKRLLYAGSVRIIF
jgi:hypothetical protein